MRCGEEVLEELLKLSQAIHPFGEPSGSETMGCFPKVDKNAFGCVPVMTMVACFCFFFKYEKW